MQFPAHIWAPGRHTDHPRSLAQRLGSAGINPELGRGKRRDALPGESSGAKSRRGKKVLGSSLKGDRLIRRTERDKLKVVNANGGERVEIYDHQASGGRDRFPDPIRGPGAKPDELEEIGWMADEQYFVADMDRLRKLHQKST